MGTALFGSIVFGPIKSRRLGISLGINLLPTEGKLCSFDCVYCECGYNAERKGGKLSSYDTITEAISYTLKRMHDSGEALDVITFAGNGEPTMHPRFADIIDFTIKMRDEFYPEVKISVLSNSTRIHKPQVFEALKRVDNNILKLDSAIQSTLDRINVPLKGEMTVDQLIDHLAAFKGKVIIQTLFLRGEELGHELDNTTPEEIEAWISALQYIKPASVMVYSLDRPTPAQKLVKIDKEELERIAEQVREVGIPTTVS